ncbi:hypothetical protein K466DRAFT_604195 [Polyporus arcularius HHB13444]|uniref:Uncharacterized protein n=1 Tax=Polyporus arcularius HHB13444 TaxID=1314778 RepID=A0A5C3NYD8_9APHY|nr:hypothetical protein K466DRAFT_604195 [Polyporus arcularius HHB13444]
MSTCRLESVDQLLGHLHFITGIPCEPGPEGALELHAAQISVNDTESDAFFEEILKYAFKRYLTGVGHPDTPAIRELLGEYVLRHGAGDPFLRARAFLHRMKVSDDVTSQPDWKIEICFKHTGNRGSPSLGLGVPCPTPIEVHTCIPRCTFIVDEGLRNLLLEPIPMQSFETWLHAALSWDFVA